ncbi:MAG: site-specific tyrosine recombinase XerC [Thermoanaerobaculia bacterium]
MSRWPERPPVGDPSDPRGFEVLIARYLEWISVHNYSPNTVVSARRLLRTFAEWCEERGIVRPADVSRSVVERYQRYIYHYRRDNGRPLGFKTQMGRLTHVRSFFKWLTRERYLLYNPTSEIILPRRPPRLPTESFTVSEVEQILRTPDLSTPLGLRDRAIVETLYSTGMRRMELVNLDLYDFDRERGWVTIRQGKGGKDRVVPIGERALRWVVKYLEEARPELVLHADEWAVFVSNRGVRFNPSSLTNLVRRLIEASGVRKRWGSCHLFRHTMATLMLENGADIRTIQEILGHANLETTQIYTKVSIHRLKEIHEATHPAGVKRSDVARELAEEIEELADEGAEAR